MQLRPSAKTSAKTQGHSEAELHLAVFEAALLACRLRDARRLDQALWVLSNFIDFRAARPSATMGVLSIYRACRKASREAHFETARIWLAFLRQTWLSES